MRRGLTVFWLVIIVFIVILVIFFYPVFVRPHPTSRQTTCLNNQRQIAISILMFVQDHENRFPRVKQWSEYPTREFGVTGKAWDCPTTSYKGNAKHPDYFYFAGPGTFLEGVSIEAIQHPETTPILADLKDAEDNKPYIDSPKEDVAEIISRVDCRHNNCAVFAYMDGHVAWLTAEKATDPQTYQGCIVKKQ